MLDDHDWQRLARYVAGECTPEEAEALGRWIDGDPERREAAAFMRDMDAAAMEGRPQWDTAASWKHLAARRSARMQRPVLVPHATGGAAPSAHSSKRPRRSRAPLRAAAVVAIAASGALFWIAQNRWPRHKVLSIAPRNRLIDEALRWTHVADVTDPPRSGASLMLRTRLHRNHSAEVIESHFKA